MKQPSKYGRIPKKVQVETIDQKQIPVDGRVMIDLTIEDIEKGRTGDCYYCPMSRACVRCIPGAYNVATTREGITVFFGTKHGGHRFFPFNEVISEYVAEYDVTGVMKPFTWEIQLFEVKK